MNSSEHEAQAEICACQHWTTLEDLQGVFNGMHACQGQQHVTIALLALYAAPGHRLPQQPLTVWLPVQAVTETVCQRIISTCR